MPKPKLKPEAEPEAAPAPVPDYLTIVGLRATDIDSVVEEFSRIRGEIAVLEARKKELAAIGAKLLIKARVKSVMVGDALVTHVAGTSTRFDKVKFAKLAGTKGLRWYEQSLVRTPYDTLKVTERKEGAEAGDGDA